MVRTETPVCDFGRPAPDFRLPGVDGKIWTLNEARGNNGLLVMFICNHCPYVKAVLDRIIRDARELKEHGINTVAIMSNDPADYPEDSFDNMKRVAQELQFPVPVSVRRDPAGRQGLRRRVHAGFLRLQQGPQAPVSRTAG